MQTDGGEVASVTDQAIQGPGGVLNLRIYRGEGTLLNEPLPCMLFLHGGGWVIGNLESHDRLCRRLANIARICVVALDYRLAPEHPFPAALEDSACAWRWLHSNAKDLSIHAQAIAVGGDSAGGNLAAALALMGRDNELIAPTFQALIYPALDLTAQSDSYQSVTEDVPLTAATMHYFIGHYTPNVDDRMNWRASPLLANDLKDLAPALVMTVAHDPLCDEGRAYAKRLEEEGVRVSAMHFNDHVHGLLGIGKLVPAANHIGDHIFRTIGFELHRSAALANRHSST
jgi:acetyl esterase